MRRDIKSYEYKPSPPSQESLAQIYILINSNLAEMRELARRIEEAAICSNHSNGQRHLLYIGSQLYDYYLLVEDCLRLVARTIDKWVPASLDWHYRLLKLVQQPIPEKRPPLISPETAELLEDYLVLAINFHEHAPRLTSMRIEKLVKNLPVLQALLENELGRLAGFFKSFVR